MAIILIGGTVYLAFGSVADTYAVVIENLKVDNETLQICGTTASSAEAFDGYNYTINNDTLYLKLRYGIVNPIHHNGDFNIILHDDLKNIKCIYLQGSKTEDKKLVWTK